MPQAFGCAIVQQNVTVGDIAGNVASIVALYRQARDQGADLVIFPELCITGYPPEDLVLRPEFQQRARQVVDELAALTADGPAMLVGSILTEGEARYNAAFLLDEGRIIATSRKHELPADDVFNEKREFAPGPLPDIITWRGMKLAILVCADMWNNVVREHIAAQKPEMVIVPNGSPYDRPKQAERKQEAATLVRRIQAPLIYLNHVGGQDELVFDGHSFIMMPDESVPVQMPMWDEQMLLTQWRRANNNWQCETHTQHSEPAEEEVLYRACVTGLRDYVTKNGFPGVILGLSGGIDSALVAAIAVDALGAEAVRLVMMPSRYTSKESVEDAEQLARALGIALESISIEPAVDAFDGMLAESFKRTEPGIAEENIQSRIRGLTLMALSNKSGHMVVTTGNKSEMAVGYATLYGDMCGGYNPIKDVYKTQVYRLARWRNQHKPGGVKGPDMAMIPERIITRAPSAELRPDQTDQDSLPPYEHLDWILEHLIEGRLSIAEIAAKAPRHITREVVEKVAHLLLMSEYKRRQAPPGVKLTRVAFGRDRRYPLTNKYRYGASSIT